MKNPLLAPKKSENDLPEVLLRGGDFGVFLLNKTLWDNVPLESFDCADRYAVEADIKADFFGFRIFRCSERP